MYEICCFFTTFGDVSLERHSQCITLCLFQIVLKLSGMSEEYVVWTYVNRIPGCQLSAMPTNDLIASLVATFHNQEARWKLFLAHMAGVRKLFVAVLYTLAPA